MGIYQKSWPTYSIAGSNLVFSESSKKWLTYEESIEYASSFNGKLPSLEEIALLRVETRDSRKEFNNEWREANKYQASRTFAAYWRDEKRYLMTITETPAEIDRKTSVLVKSFELISIDKMCQHHLIMRILGKSTDKYQLMLKESGYENITINMPTIAELSTLGSRDILIYNTGLGGDDSGMNEINLNLKDLKTRAIAVIQ